MEVCDEGVVVWFRGVIERVLAMSERDVGVFLCDVLDDGWCVVVP